MAKSLFNSLKVSETPDEDTNTPAMPRPHESLNKGGNPQGGKRGKRGPQGKPNYSITFNFESKDQAVAIGRILVYQADRLVDQANKHEKQKLTYISEMLKDQAGVIRTMAEKIKKDVPN